MSPLHPDRLTTEGAAPPPSTRRTRRQAPGTTSRKAAASAEGAAKGAREVTARTARIARAAAATAARTASGTAKAAGSKAGAVRTAAARKAAATSASGATEVAPPPAPPAVVEPAAPECAPSAARRPTPSPRIPSLDEPVAAETVEAPPVETSPAEPLAAGGPSARRRRPVLYTAAALVGALSISAAAAGETTALAETGAVHESVSVADALGVEAEVARPVVSAETTDRLGELVASRAERDQQEAHAAELQAEADEKAREEAERAAAAAAEAARPDAVLPVEGARYTSEFGPRWGTHHSGIDLAAPMRTPEYAAVDGVVLEAGPASGFGLAVYIQHENGDVTVYGHMDEILVTPGQVVQAGDTIALLGNRGQSTGPHLHFEVHEGGIGGTKIDPEPWLEDRGVELP